MRQCEFGHEIKGDENVCGEGHLVVTEMYMMMKMFAKQQEQIQTQMQQLVASSEREQKLHEALSAVARPTVDARTKTKRPERPTISTDSSDNEWQIFIDSWGRYKEMADITEDAEIRNELRATCTSDVNSMLFNLVGAQKLKTATEDELLRFIKSVSVVEVHKEVHRQKSTSMRQAEGESITHYVAKLKAQAMLCDFNVACTSQCCTTQQGGCIVSYADEMIVNQMISGLNNQEHQSKLLAEAATLPTFQQKFDRLISLETTQNAAPQLALQRGQNTPSVQAATRSKYKKQKNAAKRLEMSDNKDSNNGKEIPCRWCGHTSHLGKPMDRANCPAKDIVCHICKKKGHYPRVCREKKSNISAVQVNDEEDASVSSSIATIF